MPSKTTKENIETRFWEKVDTRSDNECWEWKTHVDNWGYGQFRYFTKMERSHRVSWMLTFGDIPNNLHVLHKCDNPRCVNPNHLFLGTDKDNAEDRENKGRGVRHPLFGKDHPQHGTKCWQAVLNESKVRKMRKLYSKGLSSYKIAKIFKVHPSTAYFAIIGKTWGWI